MKPSNKHCGFPECLKKPTFGREEDHRPKFCRQHALEGMVNVTAKRCAGAGCGMYPCFNFSHTRTAKYCKAHRVEGMVDVRSKRCREFGCNMNPCFGKPESKSALYCKMHAIPGMVDIKHRRCAEEGCDVRPSFNTAGEKLPRYCRLHAKPDMVDIISKRCVAEGCTSCPGYNYITARLPMYCKVHMLPDMVDIRNARCDVCSTRAIFGVPACKPSKCAKHVVKGMIRYPNKRCSVWRCMRIGTHESNSDRFCETHAPPDSKNLALRPCESCNLEDVLVNGKCDSCDPERARVVQHLKEEQVRRLLEREGIPFVHDKIMETTACGLERPDFLIDCGSHLVIVEVDENQHDTYACSCEITRMINLAQIGGMPMTFVRFNPDVYVSKRKCVPLNARLELLAKSLKTVMAESPVAHHAAVLDVLYLFYDDYDSSKQERRILLAAHSV